MEDGTINGGEAVVATLLSRGIDTVFFVPGGIYVTVLEALSRVQNKISSVSTRLESSATFACDAYAGIVHKPSCMFVSRAPGASNAVIGVHTAMQASRPFVLFIADIPKAANPVRMGPEKGSVESAAELVRAAKHPIILAGEMIPIEGETEALRQFADVSGAGVLVSYRQQDIIDNEHLAYFGQLTLNRLPFQIEALDACDLIINIGCRLDSTTTEDYKMFRHDQKMIMAYPDAVVFSQWQADVAMGSHTGPAMRALLESLESTPPPAERIAWRDEVHA